MAEIELVEAEGAPEGGGAPRAAEGAERTRFVLANVRQFPDPVLRMQAHEVTQFDAALRELTERMVRIMIVSYGCGLAAPQVGVLQRVLVYQADEETEPVALCNPRIAERGDEVDSMTEGCLSLAASGVPVEVERSVRIVVEATTVDGEPTRIEAVDLEARILQHEIDHLDGVLTIDRAAPGDRREALARLRPEPVLGPLV